MTLPPQLGRLVVAWYGLLSGLSQNIGFALQAWTEQRQFPLLVAILLGLIGATSPCQLTTNLGALAYASAHAKRKSPFTLAVAYVAGKISVYTVVGALVIFAGLQLGQAAIPVVIVARKALGPLMILVGLSLLGLLRLRASLGQRLASRLRERLAGRGPLGAYLLGVAFSFAFCPTLFWLFFGLLRDIHVDFDTYDIRPGDARVLDENARGMKANATHPILIEGHAGERGTNEDNVALGERRAKATMNDLVAQRGGGWDFLAVVARVGAVGLALMAQAGGSSRCKRRRMSSMAMLSGLMTWK